MIGGQTIITLLLAISVLIAPVTASAQIIQLPDCNLNPSHLFCDCSFNPGPWCEEPEPERDPIVLIPPLISSYNKKLMKKDESGGNLKFVLGGNTFKALIEKLEEVGYELGEDLFVAHYDWRQPNNTSATQYLKPKINEAKTETGASKVDLVAHSMGGLVARAYIQNDNYGNDVDQLITLGTPHAGASGAYQAWEGGQYPETWDFLVTFHIDRIEAALKKTRNMHDVTKPTTFRSFFPSLKDLLPVDPVITRDGEVIATDDLTEENSFLQTLRSTFNLITERGINLATIGGEGKNTLGEVSLVEDRTIEDTKRDRWRDGHANPDPPTGNSTDGDQTVLLASAHIGSNNITLAETDHMSLPTAAQDDVLEILGLEVVEEHFEYELPKKLFGITILSPLKAEITGPNGEVLSQNQNDFGVDSAEYDDDPNDPSDPIDITIADPPTGDYTITYTGTGEGEYTIITSYADEDEAVSSVKDGTTYLGETMTETVRISSETTSLVDDEDYKVLLEEIILLAKEAQKSKLLHGREWAKINSTVAHARNDLRRYEQWTSKGREAAALVRLRSYYDNLREIEREAHKIGGEDDRADFAEEIIQLVEKIERYSPPL